MSWYVERLIKDRDLIRAKQDIDDALFNDLLIVEKKIEELIKENMMSESEVKALRYYSSGEEFLVSRNTREKLLTSACDKVAFVLGSYFTDDGFLLRMAKQYHLSLSQIEKVKEKILK